MAFQPIIPLGGMAGWLFLQRTLPAQKAAHETQSPVKADAAYFAEKIGAVKSADDVVADSRLLKVALGAFGLDDDLPHKAFIRKVLAEGSLDPHSLANRMVDKRYLALTKAFGFDLGTPRTVLSDFSQEILSAYKSRQFEIAVGAQNNDLRLALALERDLANIVGRQTTNDGLWYAVMGNPPLRRVFETALGLPESFGRLDLDQQLVGFRRAARAVFGDSEIKQFSEPDRSEKLTRLFLVRSQINSGNAGLSSGSIALTLLQNAFG